LRREVLKQEIDDEAQKLNQELEKFKDECLLNRTSVNMSAKIASFLETIEKDFKHWHDEVSVHSFLSNM
jgi:hypothetical protein